MSVNSLARARAIQSAEPAIPSRWRSLEMVVGLISFGLVTLPVWASLISPAATALFVCFFSLYWLHSSVRFALNALLGIRRLGQACRRDWAAEAVRQPGFERLWHLVLIPTYREPEAVLTATLDHLVAQDFPRERLIVVLAFEARDAGAPDRWRALEAAYQGRFGRLWATFHPDIPGEVKGKASNETWAARWATDRLEREVGCALDDVVLTTCDADSHFHPSYFSALTRLYLNNPDRRFTIYQSAMLFYSNLWRLPLPQAALTALQSLWQLSRMVPAHRLINQSTYSLSLRSCREVGYWDRTVIPEDSHMFFQMYFHFGSRVRVDPIFLPLLADGAEGRNWLGSCRALYEQEKRWAWGVADIPFVLVGIRNGRGSRWWSRLFRCWPFVEEHLLWPANWFLLALGTRLPERLARANDRPLVDLAIDVAHVALTLSTLPLAVCAVAHYALVAGAPGQTHTRRVLTLAGWLLLPIESFVFVSLPAIEAHLRLLLGRRLEYRVTEKIAPEVGATGDSGAVRRLPAEASGSPGATAAIPATLPAARPDRSVATGRVGAVAHLPVTPPSATMREA